MLICTYFQSFTCIHEFLLERMEKGRFGKKLAPYEAPPTICGLFLKKHYIFCFSLHSRFLFLLTIIAFKKVDGIALY